MPASKVTCWYEKKRDLNTELFLEDFCSPDCSGNSFLVPFCFLSLNIPQGVMALLGALYLGVSEHGCPSPLEKQGKEYQSSLVLHLNQLSCYKI